MEDYMQKFRASGIGDKVIIVAALVFFIDSFLPWYSVDLGPFGDVNRSGWQSPGAMWSILAMLVSLVMGGVLAVKMFSAGTIPDKIGGFSWPKILLGGAVLVDLLLVIKLIDESSYMAIGWYLGIICAAAITAGAGLMYQQEMKGGSGGTAT